MSERAPWFFGSDKRAACPRFGTRTKAILNDTLNLPVEHLLRLGLNEIDFDRQPATMPGLVNNDALPCWKNVPSAN